MPGYFGENNSRLALSFDTGLRRAQRAAIWALAARVIAKEAVSQAILPTGVGKTAVIAALPFALSSTRVLIVVPSNIIRRQISREFTTLRTLKTLRVLPDDVHAPKVKTLKAGIRTEAQWYELRGYDVVVTTPNCVSSSYAHVVRPPTDLFDLLMIDEAHHVAAPTWNRLIEDLPGVPTVLLTATPFRRDKKRLPGEIVYSYPLREAIADRVYSPIDFVAVRPVPGESKDVTLAVAARKRLNLPRHINLGSQIVVRTDRVADALRLKQVYREVGLDIPVLTSELSNRETDAILEDLERGRVRGVIVVGVLTEGFDLPRLKIAVYHKKHKSFAATLQFVGRLARTGHDAVMQPELLAMPDDVGEETSELYREDTSWPELLPEIADAAVDEERRVRNYLQNFSGKPEEFSLVTVEPRLRVQVFELDGGAIDLSTRISEIISSPVVEQFIDEELGLAAFVTREIVHPDWLRSTALDTVAYDLHIACTDKNLQYLFIQTSSAATTADIIKQYNLGNLLKVAPAKINAALYTYGITDYSMVGLRNKSPNAATGFSYKTVAGFSASRGVTLADQTTTSAGHVSARFMNGASTHTIGSSLDSGKVWESSRSSLYDFREWCHALAGKLNAPSTRNAPPALNVSIREALAEYPSGRALAVVLAPELFEAKFELDGAEYSIGDCGVVGRGALSFATIGITLNNRLLATSVLNTRGIASSGRRTLRIELGGATSLSELLNEFPPTMFFANGTSVVEGTIAAVPSRLETIDAKSLETWDWTGVDKRRESRAARAGFAKNIQERAIEVFIARDPSAFIFVDDAAHEVADIVVLHRQAGHSVLIEFAHCKWSSKDASGHRIEDLSEVLTQVCRSVRWCFPLLLSDRLKYRLTERPTRLRQGLPNEFDDLLSLISSGAAQVAFVQYAIQPGLLIDKFLEQGNLSALATVGANWCMQYGADLVICGA